ncbi:alpha/beta hydrolase [Duganella sp. sic0402]|uniref:alpha/beta fold hydrolase n=1 Tax=Duganella sp. sic0402 TaxID=2854786 RepID=UPI001C465A17|nr:alpha/beta hydrolase [Duganella sp. sic0402]MBV7535281.1 alpha/beta hydrolase [Duganella sp. sic0402]
MKAVLMVLALSSGWAAASEFAVPHTLVDVGGGRKMNLYCSGAGAPTVVFDGPAGDAGWAWYQVQPEVAKHTRACIFDRAGFGFSDPSAQPNTAESVAADLHRLLQGAGEKGPYVLVGNSLGGANLQVYAYRYPQSVKGLVLAEAQHEDETERLDRVSGGKIKQIYAMYAGQNQYCLDAAEQGFAKDSEKQTQCIGEPLTNYGAKLGAAILAAELKPSYWRTKSAEYDAMSTSDEQLRKLRRPFGDIPVLVLTRSLSPYAVPGQPQSAANKAFEDENVLIQKEYTKLSTRSSQRIIPGAGHAIQADKPEAVVAAVLEVLKQVKP